MTKLMGQEPGRVAGGSQRDRATVAVVVTKAVAPMRLDYRSPAVLRELRHRPVRQTLVVVRCRHRGRRGDRAAREQRHAEDESYESGHGRGLPWQPYGRKKAK